mmetsp:Transcript_107765/g.207235  ORF Transcript_107765/g.207235 Transcript_107765/m.207235 type:complete len:86 (+) Transcript_107765:65-322(+)
MHPALCQSCKAERLHLQARRKCWTHILQKACVDIVPTQCLYASTVGGTHAQVNARPRELSSCQLAIRIPSMGLKMYIKALRMIFY